MKVKAQSIQFGLHGYGATQAGCFTAFHTLSIGAKKELENVAPGILLIAAGRKVRGTIKDTQAPYKLAICWLVTPIEP